MTHRTLLLALLAPLILPAVALAGALEIKEVRASSTYPPEGGISYDATRLMDGKVSTSWVEGEDGSGLGSWVEIDLGGEREITKIKVWAGLWYSYDYWQRANRPKALEFKYADGSIDRFELADEMKVQEFLLPKQRKTSTVRVKVDGIHSGNTWLDTAISEIQIFDASTDSRAPLRAVSTSSDAASDADGSYEGMNVGDGIMDTMWCEGNKDGDGTGEWIELQFAGQHRISSLHLVNGIGSSLPIWMKGNRASSAKLTFGDGSTADVQIKNSMMPQEISFPAKTTDKVRITFTGVTKGREYNDLCISEAYFSE